MSKTSSVPFAYQLTAGAVAGTSELLIMYPLDVVKTRMQLQQGSKVGNQNMFTVFRNIVKDEGFSRFYRGIGAPILMEAPKRATKFAANEKWSKLICKIFGVGQMSQPLSILVGAATGATEAMVVVPFELVKIRLQDRAQAHKYTGLWNCVVKIVRDEGPLALYHGLNSTVWRHVVWNAGYFGTIFQIRALLPATVTKGQKVRNDLVAGCIGGSVGTILNTPLDVVKSRIQSTPFVAGSVAKYDKVFPALKTIYHEEGFKALYRGLGPKLVRFLPGGGILLVVYTETLDLLLRL